MLLIYHHEPPNAQVHGAAVNNVAFKTRVVGGSRATPCSPVFGEENNMPDREFFTVDEVALMRFMSMCQKSFTPDLWEAFESCAKQLIAIRPDLREGCFERIESYLHGSTSRWPVHGDENHVTSLPAS
jgi:hypothetical protein